MSVITKDLGVATAYGYAKSKGYTGTEEEFAELMASYADVAQQAEASAQDAEDAKDAAITAKTAAQTAQTAAESAQTAAAGSAQTASTKASEASNSATAAAGSATAAGDSATAAAGSAETAQTAAQTATTKASEASSSASAASTAKTGAETARTGAQTAQTAAETAQANAEAAASSVSASAAQIEQNTEDITGLKNDLSEITGNNEIEFSDPDLGLYIVTNGSTINPNNPLADPEVRRKYAVVECVAGDAFTLTCSGANYGRAWAFADSQNHNLACASKFADLTNVVVVAPENTAYIVINAVGDDKCYFGNLVDTHIADIDEQADVNRENINCGGSNIFAPNSSDIEDGGFYSFSSSTNAPVWNTYSTFSETGYMPVEAGKTFSAVYADNGEEVRNTPWLFFDKNKNLVNEYSNPSAGTKVPLDASYLRLPVVTARKQYFVVLVGETYQGGYIEPYATPKEKIDSIQAQVDAIASQTAIGTQWNGKSWYAYGTSITANNGTTVTTGKYPAYLASMSGMVLTNKGVGGGGIGNLGAFSTGQVYDAICNTSDGKTSADLITLETGANDVNADVPLGTVYDTGQTTLAGCLNDCLRYLQKNTNAQVVVTCSPASTVAPTASGKYYEWAKMVEEICHINRVHFVNADNNMGYAKLADSTKGSLYVVDDIHQTDLGGYIMAQNLWAQIRSIPLFYTAIPS